MENLLTLLSEKLQAQLKDFIVYEVYVDYNEMNVRSYYTLDYSYIEAMEKELKELGKLS